MKFFISLVLVIAIYACIGVESRRIAIVGPRNDKLLVAVEAAVQATYTSGVINSTVSPLPEVVPVWLSGTASNRLATAVAAASDPDLFLALVATSDASISSVFSNSGVIVALLSSPVEPESIPQALNLNLNAPRHDSALRLLQSWSWNSTALLFSPLYLQQATQFADAARQANIAVTFNATIDASFQTSVFSSIFSSLERGSTAIVVVIADPSTSGRILDSIRDIRFEFIFVDPVGSRDSFSRIRLSGIFRASAPGVPRGLFAFAPKENSANYDAMVSYLNTFNSTAFVAGITPDIVAAYDMIYMVCNAFTDVYNAGGSTSDIPAVRSQIFASPKAFVESYTFDSARSLRTGDISIMNLRVTNFTAGQSQWVRAGSDDGSNTVAFLNASSLSFADGTSVVPASSRRSTVAIGLIWPNFRPSHRAWRLIAELAVADINANGTVLPNGLALRTVFADNLDTASATILAGQDAISRGVVGIIGPSRSSQSISLQYYIGGLNVPAISFASTADSLSDKVNYPTFFRTVVRDSLQSKAIAALMLSRNWTSYCLVNFNDDYGSSVAANIVTESQSLGIELVGRSIYSSSTVDFEPTINPLVSANCKIIIAVLDTATFGPLMNRAKAKGIFGVGNSQYVWIFAEILASVLNRAAIEAGNLTVSDFHGTIITQPALGDPNSAAYKRFLNDTTRLAVPTLAYGTFLYDAVWALTRATANVIRGGRDPVSDRLAVLGNLRNTSFTGISGLVQFDKLQDRVGGIYGIYNFRYWSASAEYVGSWTNSTGVTFSEAIIYGDNTTNVPLDRVSNVLPVVGILFSSPGGGIIIAIAVIVLLCLLGTSIYLFYKSTDESDTMALDIVRKSSPFFMGIILFGLALAVISVFFWFSPTNALVGAARCHLRVWFGFLGAAIAYSALLAKNWRVFYLFNEPSLRVIAITNQTLIAVTGAVVSPLVIILILWSALNGGFQEFAQPNAANSLAFYTCVSPNDKIFAGISFAYMGLLLVFGSILSWKTRSLPDVFKESQFIALATYNILFVTAAGVLIGYIISFEPTAYTFIIVGCILVGAAATWALIFINKFYIMKYGPPSSRTSPMTGTTVMSSNPSVLGKRSLSGGSTTQSSKRDEVDSESSSSDEASSSSEEVQKPKKGETKRPSSSAKSDRNGSKTSSSKPTPKKAPTPSETSEEESEEDSSSEEKPAPKKPTSSTNKSPSKQQEPKKSSKSPPKKASSSSSSAPSSSEDSSDE